MSGAKAAKTLVESLKRHVTSTMGNPAIERYFANVFAAEVQRPEGARLAEDYAFLLESIAGHRVSGGEVVGEGGDEAEGTPSLGPHCLYAPRP